MSIPNGGILHFDIAKLSESMHLTPEEVRQYFTDGRRVSFVLERRIVRELTGGVLADSEGAAWDLIDANGGKWEVRSLTRGGIYFCPSYMVGSGRSFDEPGFLRKLTEIEGYIISDVDEFPDIPVWIVERSEVQKWYDSGFLGATTKISKTKALALLSSWIK